MVSTLQALAENKLLLLYFSSAKKHYWKAFCVPEQDGRERCQEAEFHEKYMVEREQLWAWGKESMPLLGAVDQPSLEDFLYLHFEEPALQGSKMIPLGRSNCIKMIIKQSLNAPNYLMGTWHMVTAQKVPFAAHSTWSIPPGAYIVVASANSVRPSSSMLLTLAWLLGIRIWAFARLAWKIIFGSERKEERFNFIQNHYYIIKSCITTALWPGKMLGFFCYQLFFSIYL